MSTSIHHNNYAVTLSASIKAWIVKNYLPAKDSYITCDSLMSHALEEKENILVEGCQTLTAVNITRAINELYGDNGVTKCRKRCKDRRVWVYSGISKRHKKITSCENRMTWTATTTYIKNMEEQFPEWQVLYNEHSITCIHVENTRFDGQRALTEIVFSKDKNGVQYINYHQRRMPPEIVNAITRHFTLSTLCEEAHFLMTMLEKSYVCQGVGSTIGKELEVSNLNTHTVIDDDVLEQRNFSTNCQVFTNTRGIACTECEKAKKIIMHKKRRREMERTDGPNYKYTNHRYMSKEEIVIKLERERKINRDLKRKIEKLEKELLDVESEDHKDLSTIMTTIDQRKDVPEDMLVLWEQQRKILTEKHSTRYRWHPKIMKLCIELYAKNPHVLDPLRKVIYLPSNRTIRHYKNKVEQSPGWKSDILEWCVSEARANGLKTADFWGGLVLDEMKIQEDIEMVVKNGKHRITGFVDLGQIHTCMEAMSGKDDGLPKLASHVLQFIFLGDSGFRFPIAQFPSNSCTPSSLYFLFWEGVMKMFEFGFTIYYCILDGAEVNRQFIRLHFSNDADVVQKSFMTPNPFTGIPLIFLMDPKHNFKKLRNNILKSSLAEDSKKCLTVHGQHITWEHFVSAFRYDQGEFSMSLNNKLTADHFYLNPASKMRNHLAENVLDKDMLRLIKAYKEHLKGKTGQEPKTIDSTIELLGHSSKAIQIFHNKVPISSPSDPRLKELAEMLSYFDAWRNEVKGNEAKMFISPKLYFDIQSMVLGFRSIVATKLKYFPHSVIKPAIVNQDVVENHFAQVRACNGQNSNPTWRLQESTQNTIRLGQTTISRKSNAGITSLKIKK